MSVLGWWVPRSDGNLECQPSKQSPLDPRDKKPGSLGQGSKTYKRGAREKYDPFQRRRRRARFWGAAPQSLIWCNFSVSLPTLCSSLQQPAAAVEPVRPRCAAKLRAVHSFTVHCTAQCSSNVAASALFLRGKVQRSGETWIGGRGRQTQKNICFSLSRKFFVQKVSH